MAESGGGNEPISSEGTNNLTPEQLEAKKRIEDRMTLVKEKYGSPEQRAEKILNKIRQILKDESSWDVVCACTQFLGDVAELYDLKQEVQQLGFQVQLVHYFKIEHE